jgi:hypothetical protein
MERCEKIRWVRGKQQHQVLVGWRRRRGPGRRIEGDLFTAAGLFDPHLSEPDNSKSAGAG